MPAQPVLAPLAAHGRSLTFRLDHEADPRPALERLREVFVPAWGVVGLGAPLVGALGAEVAGLRVFPALSGPGVSVPSTQDALWVYLLADHRSTVFARAEAVVAALSPELVLDDALDMFLHDGGRDLTGYEDGTENPTGDDATTAALNADGSSFVAVQRWQHDLRRFASHPRAEQDAMIGRERDTNEELEDAPESAHVKRTAQESFDPESFLVRRSMPWSVGDVCGLEFVAYAASLDTFERILRRMVGEEDGLTDALFRFSRPRTGGYYWVPPVTGGQLDLTAVT